MSEVRQCKKCGKAKSPRSDGGWRCRPCERAKQKEYDSQHHQTNYSRFAMSLQEIGDKFGLSKERVRQLESRALRKLRNGLASDPELMEWMMQNTREA